jgi:serine/threonine protein kinase
LSILFDYNSIFFFRIIPILSKSSSFIKTIASSTLSLNYALEASFLIKSSRKNALLKKKTYEIFLHQFIIVTLIKSCIGILLIFDIFLNEKKSDLKPENLLYESDAENAPLKVIDFGTSRTFDPNVKMNQKFGTVPIFFTLFNN